MVNLIKDRWIPVITRSGSHHLIAPYELIHIDGKEEEIPEIIDAVRPDFQGSYIQFLIGLVQTLYEPANEEKWRKIWRNPPGISILKEIFETVAPYFEVEGDYDRFMQDPSVKEVKMVPIGRILLEMPGNKAEKENRDHFLKRGTVSSLCPYCAATALFTLQTNASFGGAGHLVGLRGGGPMTTLIKGETLWKTIWLNILSTEDTSRLGRNDLSDPGDIFPWVGDGLRMTGKICTSQDVNYNQIFWAIPRRIFLHFSKEKSICDCCGKSGDQVVHEYSTEKGGINYKGGWKHTLSPYYSDGKGGDPGAIHVQPGGISYRNWLGVIQSKQEKNTTTVPAQVIFNFKQNRQDFLWDEFGVKVPLWAFGYDMDQAKARCYYESEIPLPFIPKELRERFDIRTTQWIQTASHVLKKLKESVKMAWSDNSKDYKWDLTILDLRFWHDTEPYFYVHLSNSNDSLSDPTSYVDINLKWLAILRDEAFLLFDEYSQYDQIGFANPRKIALARKNLLIMISPGHKTVGDLLGLPVSSGKRKKRENREIKEKTTGGTG